MQRDYEPDSWVVLKVNDENPHYRLLCGWRGNYQKDGRPIHEEWKLSGGIVSVEDKGDSYFFTISNENTYNCNKTEYFVQKGNMHVLRTILDNENKDVEFIKHIENFEEWKWLLE